MKDTSPNSAETHGQAAKAEQPAGLLIDALHDELRLLAAELFAKGRPALQITPAELIQAGIIRISPSATFSGKIRAQIFADCGKPLREALAQAHTLKAPRSRLALLIGAAEDAPETDSVDLTQIHSAVAPLYEADPALARLVDLRFFSGLTLEEISEIEEISPALLTQRWRIARAWLHDALKSAHG